MKLRLVRFVPLALLALPLPLPAQIGDLLTEPPQQPLPAATHFAIEPARTAAEEQRSFRLPPGFSISLVAAEPLVHDPVAATYDDEGNLWVAEMSQYNVGMTKDLPWLTHGVTQFPTSKLIKLVSTHHDGHYDRRIVWLDHDLGFPRGIAFVPGGILIADPPRLWIARDLHHTGHCDDLHIAIDDYGVPVSQEESGNLLWGRDNVLHGICFTSDYRWQDGKLSRIPVPYRGQFGLTQDDTGRLYYSLNSDQLRGDPFPAWYAVRNPNILSVPWADTQIAHDQEVWPSHPTPAINRGYRRGELGKSTGGLRDDATLLEFTSACSAQIYRGANFPASFYGNAFVPDPTSNLVKRNLVLEGDGQLTAVNAYIGREFLTSNDTRFRPVALADAPDGSMTVVDLYRGVMEEYHFITSYLRDQIVRRGLNQPLAGQGRLWRIVYDRGPLETRTPSLQTMPAAALAGLLSDPNAWWRDNAQRVLVQRGGAEAVPALEDRARHAPLARTRLYALWTLDGLQAATPGLLRHALRDPSAEVRQAAVRLHERWLSGPSADETVTQLGAVLHDPQPAVAVQLALTLGQAQTPAAMELMRQVLLDQGAHPYVPSALATGLKGREVEFFRSFAPAVAADGPRPEIRDMAQMLAGAIVHAGDKAAVDQLLALIGDKSRLPAWLRIGAIRGFAGLSDPAFRRSIPGGAATPAAALAPLEQSADADVAAAAREIFAPIQAMEERIAAASRPAAPFTPEQQARYDEGRTLFQLCAACHGVNGTGTPHVAPSLVDSQWVPGNPEVLVRILLNGKEGTPGFPGTMPAAGANFTDEQIAAVLTYVRNSWGLHYGPVSLAQVAKSRRENHNRISDYNDQQLGSLTRQLKATEGTP